jgi:hypothetical protein
MREEITGSEQEGIPADATPCRQHPGDVSAARLHTNNPENAHN